MSHASGHVLFLTHADTDVLAVASIRDSLDPQLPPVRVINVGSLRDEAESHAFFETHVPGASIVLGKLHGGVRSLPGFTDLVRFAADTGAWLVAMPGTDELDPELTAYSSAGVPVSHEAKAHFQLGGLENYRQCLNFSLTTCWPLASATRHPPNSRARACTTRVYRTARSPAGRRKLTRFYQRSE